ncbi:MAG TPA: hypothetical protein VGC56_08675, partial [Allosphingosinicella sp.]
RYRLVHVRHFADEIRERDFAKTCQSLALLDFRKPQNSGDDRKRLIECLYRLVCNHLQLLERLGAGAAALNISRARVSGVRRSCAMLLPTPARDWTRVSISSSMPLTIIASLEKGSPAFRAGVVHVDFRQRYTLPVR